eukprot:4960320-Pleurochrysis_carterae.AAC.1
MRLAFFDALSSSNLLKCDIQYENQAKKELRAKDESKEGWKEIKADALWHHLLHRVTTGTKPGDGAPKLLGAYKLGRAEARLATGQRLMSEPKESLNSVFTQILGASHNTEEPTMTRDTQTANTTATPDLIRRISSRDFAVLQETLQSMVGQSIRFLVETLLPDVDTTIKSFENVELWPPGRWTSAGFAGATFHQDRTRAEWEFTLAEHKWAGEEGILARHELLLGNGDALLKALRAEGRVVAMIP